jgi:nucleoside-triphosphatase
VGPISNLLLTGRPGIGKSTVIQRLLPLLADVRMTGFVTGEIREAGQRVGFEATSLAGESRILAHRRLVSDHRVGGYGVDVETVDYMVDTTLDERIATDLYVVDEIGKMELASRRFVAAMQRLMADPRPLVATVAQRGPGLIDSAGRRADVEVWQVDAANRDTLPERAAAWVMARVGR